MADTLELVMDQATKDILNATPTKPAVPKGVRRLSYTAYCRKDLLYRSGGMLIANWERSFGTACDGSSESGIDEGSVISLEELRKCAENGKMILVCEHY